MFLCRLNPIRRGVITDHNISGSAPNISGSAPNTGMPVCYAPSVETGPRNKEGELLEPPILTTPQRFNPWSPFTYGGIEVEGARKSTILIGPCEHFFFLYSFKKRLGYTFFPVK